MTSAARAPRLFADAGPSPQDIHAGVWHAHALASPVQAVQASGDALLDAQLPGGGWPVGALVELLQPAGVHSEWRLLLPALARCGSGPVVLVAPPYLPFVPALSRLGLRAGRLLSVQPSAPAGRSIAGEAASRLWTTEQVLRCAEVDAVLAWLPQARGEQLRRLHMAAADHHKLLFVMRPESARAQASPAVLRLLVQPYGAASETAGRLMDGLDIDILKRRGPPLRQSLQVQARSQRLGMLLAAGHALDRAAAAA
jgi:protein ImuA